MTLNRFLSFSFSIILSLSAISLMGCQTNSSSRQPSSVQFEFDSAKVQLLKWAAQNRIMFQFPDSTFNDVAVTQIQDSCKSLKEPAWSDAVFSTLESLKKNSTLQNKIHVIEVKRGNVPKAEITKDLDGVTYLSLSYSVSEKKSILTDISQIPCENKTTLYIGEELKTLSYSLPHSAQVAKALKDLPARAIPDRWKFNTDFLKYLAASMTLLRFNPDLGFEKSADGQFFLSVFLNEQAEAIRNKKFTAFDYWLSEIAQRSHTGSYLKILALVQDKQLGYGMETVQNSSGLAFPVMSFKSLDGHYTYTSLDQLNQCLEKLSSRYKRGLASIRSDFSTQPDSFLSPGLICHLENP
jgi:hypothetical protein